MHIYVYAICKNESRFAARWMESMSEADGVYVLDTGSTDDTVEKLTELGAHVARETIDPWRFDTARNRSLELVPEDADLCVCTDLDEVFHPGWREACEKAMKDHPLQLRYRYVWSFQPDGSEGSIFWIEKMHVRYGFHWQGAVHEVLRYEGNETYRWKEANGVVLEHHPDEHKSRGQYLSLLELAVAEEPQNDRNMHYLGREYFFYRRWDDCIRTLERHLQLPSALWKDERCASMRYLARAFMAENKEKEAFAWFCRAIGEAPYLREPYLDFAVFLLEKEEWPGVLWLTERALELKERPQSYICEGAAWSYLPYDLAALAAYNLGNKQKAREYGQKALEAAPWMERLRNNMKWYAEE